MHNARRIGSFDPEKNSLKVRYHAFPKKRKKKLSVQFHSVDSCTEDRALLLEDIFFFVKYVFDI